MHQPTPWRVDKYDRIIDATGRVVSVCGVAMPCGYVPKDDQGYDNQRLIVEAANWWSRRTRGKERIPGVRAINVKLLEALREGQDNTMDMRTWLKWRSKARAAIAEAEGRA